MAGEQEIVQQIMTHAMVTKPTASKWLDVVTYSVRELLLSNGSVYVPRLGTLIASTPSGGPSGRQFAVSGAPGLWSVQGHDQRTIIEGVSIGSNYPETGETIGGLGVFVPDEEVKATLERHS